MRYEDDRFAWATLKGDLVRVHWYQGDQAFGRANGDFLSRLYVALRNRDPRARLLTVGADYSGTSDTPYLRGLRATLRMLGLSPGARVEIRLLVPPPA